MGPKDFWPQKILGPKNFGSEKNFDENSLGPKFFLCTTKFWGQKIEGPKKLKDQKNMVQKMLGKKNLTQRMFGSKILVHKNQGIQKNWVQNLLSISDQLLMWMTHGLSSLFLQPPWLIWGC